MTRAQLETDSAESELHREDSVAWLDAHHALLRAYPGQWVALDGRKLVAYAASFLAVMKQLEVLGVEHPFLVPVGSDEAYSG